MSINPSDLAYSMEHIPKMSGLRRSELLTKATSSLAEIIENVQKGNEVAVQGADRFLFCLQETHDFSDDEFIVPLEMASIIVSMQVAKGKEPVLLKQPMGSEFILKILESAAKEPDFKLLAQYYEPTQELQIQGMHTAAQMDVDYLSQYYGSPETSRGFY